MEISSLSWFIPLIVPTYSLYTVIYAIQINILGGVISFPFELP